MKIKKFLLVFILFILIMPQLTVAAQEEDMGAMYEQALEDSGAKEIEETLPDYAKDFIDSLGVDLGDINSFDTSDDGMLSAVMDIVADGFRTPLKSLILIISVILLYAMVNGLWFDSEITPIAGYISALSIAVGALFPLVGILGDTVSAINGISKFMLAFVPIYAGIILAGGGAKTAGSFSGLLMGAAQIVSSVINTLVVPFLSIFLSLSFAGAISEMKLEGLLNGVKKAAVWTLTLGLTLFCGVLGIQTTVTAAGDNLSMKTARFMAGSFLPVVGGSVGEAMSTVGSCVGLLKGAVGAYSMVAVLAILLPIFFSLIGWRAVLFAGECVADIFGVEMVRGMLKSIGGAVTILIGLVIWTALLFIISLSVVTIAARG